MMMIALLGLLCGACALAGFCVGCSFIDHKRKEECSQLITCVAARDAVIAGLRREDVSYRGEVTRLRGVICQMIEIGERCRYVEGPSSSSSSDGSAGSGVVG